jgi:hypothetical protein
MGSVINGSSHVAATVKFHGLCSDPSVSRIAVLLPHKLKAGLAPDSLATSSA